MKRRFLVGFLAVVGIASLVQLLRLEATVVVKENALTNKDHFPRSMSLRYYSSLLRTNEQFISLVDEARLGNCELIIESVPEVDNGDSFYLAKVVVWSVKEKTIWFDFPIKFTFNDLYRACRGDYNHPWLSMFMSFEMEFVENKHWILISAE